MAQEHASTGRTWDDPYGGPVPFPRYRCPATAAESDRPGRTHLCRKPVDHNDEEHICICGRRWEAVAS